MKIFKMFSKEELERAAEDREQQSQAYKTLYENGGGIPNESALREFCRIDPFAIKTGWVQDALQIALLSGNSDLLKNIFTGSKGQKKSRITIMAENLYIQNAVDKMAAATGLPKSHPVKIDKDELSDEKTLTVFDVLYTNDDDILPFLELSARTLSNRYQGSLKQRPDVMIEQKKTGVILHWGPAKEILRGETLIGIFEAFSPDDGGKPGIKGRGIFNMPKTKGEAAQKAFGVDPYMKMKEAFKPYQ